MFTLGLAPSINKNILLGSGFIPTFLGQSHSGIALAYALGGILLSHPFEVARVIIQNNGAASGMFGDGMAVMRGLYATEGLAGLYRGVVPRTFYILPTLVGVSAFTKTPILE
jgi:hypothetical protein